MSTTDLPAGLDPRNCNAVKRDGSGDRCRLRAGHGTDHVGVGVCRRHGGNTKAHRVAAQAELAEQAVATYGLPRTVGAHEALQEELERTAGHVSWLQVQIAALEALADPVFDEHGVPSAMRPHHYLELYRGERKHFREVAKDCIASGVLERQVAVVEQQADWMAARFRGLLERLQMLDDPRALEAVRAELTNGKELS